MPGKTKNCELLAVQWLIYHRNNRSNGISIRESDSTFSIHEDFIGLCAIKSSKCTCHYINTVRYSLAAKYLCRTMKLLVVVSSSAKFLLRTMETSKNLRRNKVYCEWNTSLSRGQPVRGWESSPGAQLQEQSWPLYVVLEHRPWMSTVELDTRGWPVSADKLRGCSVAAQALGPIPLAGS